ncbi:ankyrin repeat domain-containing protein 26-like isoform X3 [Branchiostoma floridae]|uniref:Ankyrin repeat domain-containing protein 26-like isoform X3 n=1 Tax=Branchiostoma floridae TaxID=7739 RepID=A0A9J7L5A2_BRAFL|nr:ankyrin repeat domain-containing protein 26-like isoform X3 [Branchiostoma floridae]
MWGNLWVEAELAEAKQVRRERMLSAGSGSFSLSEDDFDGHLGRGRPTSRRSGTTAVNGGSSRHHGDYTGVDADLDLSVSTDTEMEDVVDQSPLANMRITSQSPLNDSSTLLKLNQRLQEVSRQLEREKAGREEGQVKVRSLESERNDLKRRLDTANREKSNLDTIKIDLEGEIRKLKYQLGEEQERRKTADTVLNKTKEQLAKKETQYSQEVENKQKSELTIRGLQIELRSTQSQVKALEEERDEARRLLSAEKQARQSQEEHHNEQMQQLKNEEISKLSVDRSEALNKLESADDTRRSVSDHNEKLKSELMHLKIELERQRTRYRDEYGLLHSENEELNNKIEELKNEINRVKVARRTEKRMSEEALAHSHAMFNNQLAQVKSQNAVLTADLDKERSQKDRLTAELDSLKQRLQSASQELEKGHLARNELERASQHERDELKRAIDHKEAELSALRENKRGLGQQLGTAESRIKGLEHEIQMTQASLNEKNNQLNNLQRDLDQRRGNLETLEQRVLQERDNSTKLKAKLETANEKIAGLQNESLLLKQQAEESKFGGRPGSRGAGGEQDRLQGMLDRMKDENQRLKDSLEEKNKSLTDTVNMMREEMRSQDMNRSSSNMEYQRMQQELSDAMKRVSLAEAALEGVKKAKDGLEIEKNALQGEIERLKSKVMGLEEQRHDSQTKIRELQDHAKEMERHSVDPQRKAELETSVQKLQMEKAQLDATLKHEQTRAEMMQKDLEDSHKVRSSLEALVANLKTSNVHLEDKLSEEAANRSLFARDAEDSRALWESEVKSRSKLGLRIAQLEREKAEAHTGVDEEKRRIKRMAELKKMSEEKMHEEMQRNTRLQEDLATARMQLRGAKKKLKEFMSGDWGQERKALQGTIETLRKQVGEVRGQLEQEEQMRAKADMLNRQLQNDMTSYKTMEKEVQRFEKLKEQIEDEFIKYKQHVDSNFVDKSYIDNYKKQLEAQSRTELNSKLQQVNEYLEGQAQARNKLDKLRDSNDEKIRSEYEQSMNGLKGELARLRSSLNDSLTQRETVIAEKDRFMEKYNEAIKKAERLNSQLEKERERNTESVTKLTVERQKLQDVSSGLLNTSMGGTLHISSLMNNSTDGEDALTRKVRQELDRSIAHHMSRPPTSLGPSRSRRESPMKDNDSAYLNSLRRNYFV